MTAPATGTAAPTPTGAPADPGQPPATGPTGTPASGSTLPPGTTVVTEPTTTPGEGPPVEPTAKTYTEDYVKKLRDENAGHRQGKTAAEQKAAELEAALTAVRKVLDPNAAAEADPAKVAEQAMRDLATERAERLAEKVERLAEKAARKAGADEYALLDSSRFKADLAKLDPKATTFADDLNSLVEASVKANPRFKTTAPRSAVDSNGGTAQPGQLTQEHLKSMTAEQIVEAKEAGRLSSLLGG